LVVPGDLSGPELSSFRYVVFGLSGCSGVVYLSRSEPLAWALAALMRPGESRAAHKLACHRRIAEARLADERRILLMDFVEAYLELTAAEAREYRTLGAQNHKGTTAVWMT
jgi:hypothetical protein